MKFCPKCRKEYADNIESCSIDGTGLVVSGPDTDPLLGATLAGRYQILQKIGQGGMGTVYKAIHTRMNRTCAIKLLAADQAEGQNPVERFNREAQMASRIDNPHAVVIYDFGETEDGVLYLVMEYVDGESLGRVLLQEKTFTPARVCSIARQIAEALGAAHTLGIVHRDLKPDNVMLGSRGGAADFVKVLDFGIAKTVSHDAAEDLTQTGFVLGTPAYMSPEQLSGEKLDARSDIYSLALIVYQMLSGKLPFEGENTQARLIKRLIDSPVPLRRNAPSISAELESAVMAGLARSRDDRPASAAAFANSLQACIGGETTAAGPTRLTEPVSVSSSPSGPTVRPDIHSGSQPRDTEPQSGPTGADSLPTVPIGAQITSANDAGTQVYDAPSSYVTRQSTTPMVSESSGGSHQAVGREASLESAAPGDSRAPGYSGQSPSGQPGPGAPLRPAEPLQRPEQPAPTRLHSGMPVTRLDQPAKSSFQPPPETVEVPAGAQQTPATRINPRQGPVSYEAGPISSQPLQGGAKKKSAAGLLIVLMGVGLLAVAGGGVLVYLKYFRNGATGNPPISRVPAPGPGPTMGGGEIPAPTATTPVTTGAGAGVAPTNPEAAAHLAAGKAHQKQAEMLSGNGSASAADEERLKATAEYRAAIKLQQVFPEAHENLGVTLYDSGRVSDALDEYKTAIDQYTSLLGQPTSQIEFNYGLALFNSRRYREAASAFGRALDLDPSDYDAYAHRAFALQNAGDYQSAKQDYQQYLSLEPSGQYAEGVKQILAGRASPPTGTGGR